MAIPASRTTRPWALCAWTMLLGWVCMAYSQETTILQGELQMYTTHVPAPLDGDSFFLKYQEGDQERLAKLIFKNKPADVMSGDKIQVAVRSPTPQARALAETPMVLTGDPGDILEVAEHSIIEQNPRKDFNYFDGTFNITSITFLTKICGVKSVDDVPAFKRRWLNAYNPDAGRNLNTLENYHKECSWGKARFTSGDNIIVDLTNVDMGCSGYWNAQPWSASRCGTAEIFGWQNFAKDYAMKNLGINFTAYSRWITVLPNNACPWSGLASVGCGRNCVSWLKGPYASAQFSTPFHELGHNLGLQHATTPGVEYGDGSSAMGGCCGDRCLNAPQSFQTTWAQTIAKLDGQSFKAGVWFKYSLPGLATNRKNHIQVVPSWMNGATTPSYFFSYRTPFEWDAFLLSAYQNGVSVHIFNGTQQAGPFKSELQGVLSVGAKYTIPKLGLTFQFLSKNSTFANVQLCRSSQSVETNCGDGLDNDCNGLIDSQDPNCKGRIPPAPPAACKRDGICNKPTETYWNCPWDCPPVCGDGICEGAEEASNCPSDCPPVCGDCFCDAGRSETALTCPYDCPPVCGDGFCDRQRGENAANCPDTIGNNIQVKGDCPASCGDGFCDSKRAPWEWVGSCPLDCPPECGDGVCSRAQGENSMNCLKDCDQICGDRFCDTLHGESQSTCPRDCPATLLPPSLPPPPLARPPKPSPPPCRLNSSAFSPPPPFPPGTIRLPSRPPPPRPAIRSPPPVRRPPPRPSPRPPPRPSPRPPPRPSPRPPPRPSPRPPPRPSPRPPPRAAPKPPSRSPPPRISPRPSPRPPVPSPRLFRHRPPRPPGPPRPPRPPPRFRPRPPRPPPRSLLEVLSDVTLWHDPRQMQALQDPLLQPVCGDGFCHHTETAQHCPGDCPAVCGDGFCDKYRHENNLFCPGDCPSEWCGDGVCGVSETEHTCASDCCAKVTCGDGVCQKYAGENCLNCPQDCAASLEDNICCGAYMSCSPKQCTSNGFSCVEGCTASANV